MDKQEKELREQLTGQAFDAQCAPSDVLEQRKQQARQYAGMENAIAVLSDFHNEVSFIFSGDFGQVAGLSTPEMIVDSAFEEAIFSLIPQEELLDRHMLELRFFQHQKMQHVSQRRHYNTVNLLHFLTTSGRIPVLHRTYYLDSYPDGSIWLSLCLYTPFVELQGTALCGIVNNQTGETILDETYEQIDRQLLSPRETDVLRLLAKGKSSKQIADALCISVNTVYRHRQNILSALQVCNTAAAVELAMRSHILS